MHFNGIFGINMGNKMGINMGNNFLGVHIGNVFELLVSKKVRVACRGGLRRKIIVKNDLMTCESAFFAKNVIF